MNLKRFFSLCIVVTVLFEIAAFTPVQAATPGWKQEYDSWYYYDSEGNPVSGWKKISGKWYYFDDSGWMYSDTYLEIGGKTYFFAKNGVMQTGWIKTVYDYGDELWTEWNYAESNGALLQKAWKQIGGVWYWFDEDCRMVWGGSLNINGKLYVFQNNGALVSKAGWVKTNEGWFYTRSDGTAETGWKKLGGKWYYFTPSWGVMVTGGYTINGVLYSFDSSGALASTVQTTGWKKIKGYWFYIDSNNKAVTGWKKIDGKWYYFDKTDGAMIAGSTYEIDGTVYAFNSNGTLVTKAGWYKEAYGNDYVSWFYTNSNGTCLTNKWKKLGGKWYYFNDWGSMVTDEYYELKGKVYSFDTNGAMRTGWISLWGSKYYADPVSGAFAAGKKMIDGKWYEFDQNNYWLIEE